MPQYFGTGEKRRSVNILFLVMNVIPKGEQFLRPQLINYKQLCVYVCLCRSSIEKLVRENKFPKPQRFEGTNRVLFFTHEVDLWINGLWKGVAK